MASRLYLDAAAAQPVYPAALRAMQEAIKKAANPSALHAEGRAMHAEKEKARQEVARALGVRQEEIIFTSGTTESTNIVINSFRGQGPLVLSAGEHPATHEAARATGNEVRIVPLLPTGQWSVSAMVQAAQGAALVSVAVVQSETGVRQPVEELHKALVGRVALHLDAAQAWAWEEGVQNAWGAEYLSIGGGKVGAGPGIGVLYARTGTPLVPLTYGGQQEAGRRAGTENSGGIAALCVAVQEMQKKQKQKSEFIARQRDHLEKILKKYGATIVGQDSPRAPHIIAAHLPGYDAEEVVMRGDALGIALSAGSACRMPGKKETTYTALGYPPGEVIRLSLPWSWTRWQTHQAVARLKQLLHTLRTYEASSDRRS